MRCLLTLFFITLAHAGSSPNIVIIMADDRTELNDLAKKHPERGKNGRTVG